MNEFKANETENGKIPWMRLMALDLGRRMGVAYGCSALLGRGMSLRALDLFCGSGGASMGLHRAGFDVTGVDIKPQPRYPFRFVQADALEPPFDLSRFDFIWASPPCQAYSVMKSLKNAKAHPDLIPATRAILLASGVPFAIENVPGAPLRNAFTLCGSMFGLKSGRGYLRRHRLFETSFYPGLIPHCQHYGLAIGVYGHGSAGHLGQRMRTANAAESRELLGIDWATRDGMSQAIPPVYSEFIGRAFLAQQSRDAAA